MAIKANMLLLFVAIKYLYLSNFDEFRIVKQHTIRQTLYELNEVRISKEFMSSRPFVYVDSIVLESSDKGNNFAHLLITLLYLSINHIDLYSEVEFFCKITLKK